jgi:topoisomerase-4 subunit B
MAPKQAVYDASAIQALKGLEPVRRMPGMYTHTVHPLHIVQEAIDNAVDEALAGFGKRITVSVFKDGSVQVEDEGRGIPVDMHKEEKKPAVEVAFSMLHAGGKFSRSGDGVYHISGGLHGVGVAVSNALSKRCEVVVFRNNEKYSIAFEGGELKNKLKAEKSKEKKTGTGRQVVAGSEVLRLAEHPDERAGAPGSFQGLPASRPDDGARGRGQADAALEVRARHGAVLRDDARRAGARRSAFHGGTIFR